MPRDAATLIDTIANLADNIARVSPDCADKALLIVEIAHEITMQPDRELVQDAIESKLVDGEMSDAQLSATTSAVLGALKAGR